MLAASKKIANLGADMNAHNEIDYLFSCKLDGKVYKKIVRSKNGMESAFAAEKENLKNHSPDKKVTELTIFSLDQGRP